MKKWSIYIKECMPRFWYQSTAINVCLIPLSYIYRAVVFLRYRCYRFKLRKTAHFNVPVVVVGNLSVGGTGKTPLVAALAEYLKKNGFSPGLISRGYGGSLSHTPQVVSQKTSVQEVGDEAILLTKKTGCPLVVGKKRTRAMHTLLINFNCDVVICDDGLQHYALGRDIEIAIIDGHRYFGNGHCLPAGPLREPINRLSRTEFVVVHRRCCENENQKHYNPKDKLRDFYHKRLSNVFHIQSRLHRIHSLMDPNRELSFAALRGRIVYAVAAIGHPQFFFHN